MKIKDTWERLTGASYWRPFPPQNPLPTKKQKIEAPKQENTLFQYLKKDSSQPEGLFLASDATQAKTTRNTLERFLKQDSSLSNILKTEVEADVEVVGFKEAPKKNPPKQQKTNNITNYFK